MSFFQNLVGSINQVVDSVVDTYSQTNTIIKVDGQSFRITKLLGEGGFSFVYLAHDEQKQLYAIKTIRCDKGRKVADKAIKEAIITNRFKHKHIVPIVDMCMIKEEDVKTVYIIMPFYKRGNLQDMIETKKSLSEKQLLTLFYETCLAVQELHNHKPMPWAHRDIKPANILLSDEGHAILMDFGSAQPARTHITDRKQAMHQQDDAAEHCSMPYRAPELFDVKVDTTLDEKVDIWSLGCTLFAMAYGESPFEMTVNSQGGTMALAVLNRQFYFPQQNVYTKKFCDLIHWLIHTDPMTRPAIDAVIKVVNKLL